MMGDWNLPDQGLLVLPEFVTERILVEYDGPQIVTALHSGNFYLGVASDEAKGIVRWIYAPVTKTEVRALLRGVVSLREALLKPLVFVIDVDQQGKPARAWECEASGIGSENLPDPGALLPRATLEAFASQAPENPEFCLDRQGSFMAGVSFRPLSELLNVFQRLWNAIAQPLMGDPTKDRGAWKGELADRAALSLAGASTGSLVLHVNPADRWLFDHVARHFEELVRANDNQDALAAILARLGSRVQARYDELLVGLEKHGLQLLTHRRDGAAFLSAHSAARIRMALPRTVTGQPKELYAVGHFIALDTRGAVFEFHDDMEEESYRGQVHSDVLVQHKAVVVGDGTRYRVMLDVTTSTAQSTESRQTYLLREIGPIESASR